MEAIISAHNSKILNSKKEPTKERDCNCRKKDECQLRLVEQCVGEQGKYSSYCVYFLMDITTI